MKRLILIDTFGFLFRSYFALPPLKSPTGQPVGVLMGFANLLMQLHRDYKQEYVIFALESKEENLRKGIDPSYKATRPDAPMELLEQIPIVIQWIERMGLSSCSMAGYEADDVIATLSRIAKEQGMEVVIISHDKDLYQLIDEKVHLYNPIAKQFIGKEECYAKYGVYPECFIDYQSIVGDSVDNVPGVKGIGAKGAKELIEQWGNLDAIYAHLDTVHKRYQKLLISNKENAYLSKQLVTLERHIPLTLSLETCVLPKENPLLHILQDLEELDFKRILSKITPKHFKETRVIKTDTSPNSFILKPELILSKEHLFEVLKDVNENDLVAFDTETTSLDTKSAQIVGFSFALNSDQGYYVPLNHSYIGVPQQISMEVAKDAIEKIFKAQVIGHNIKYDLEVLSHNFNFVVRSDRVIDTMILAWLLESDQALSLDFLAKKYFSHKMIAFNEIVSKKGTFADVFVENAAAYAAEDAQATYKLYESLLFLFQESSNQPLLDLAHRVEFPFICVIQKMEESGIQVDIDFFEHFKKEAHNRVNEITEEVYTHSQCTFNLNSPLQLGEILFERLKLPVIKKTKMGYGTDEGVLLALKDSHPIITPLLEYREIFKLKNTYIEPLLQLAKATPNHRIHTSFLQTGTATGRLSSRNPNLQNIPVRTDLGKRIRQGFIAKEGSLLLSLDYSQIELRLLAHFSQDPTLLEAFRANADIHYETAKRIFTEAYAQENRAIAKNINFGLIYGMGAKKLSETLNISVSDAKQYIQSYFDSFPTVKSYLKHMESFILKHGYSETLLKRKRKFQFLHAAPYQKAAFLREGINMVFQGSAADLIKLAMLEIDALNSLEFHMLLQIHDELIFEVKKESIEFVSKQLTAIMEGIYPLNVPLLCGVSVGKNWGELK